MRSRNTCRPALPSKSRTRTRTISRQTRNSQPATHNCSRYRRANVLLLARFPHRFIEHHRRLPGRDSSTKSARQVGSAHSLIRAGAVRVRRSMASLAIVASTGNNVRSLFQSADRPSGVSSGTSVARAAQALIVAISSGGGFRDWRTAPAER